MGKIKSSRKINDYFKKDLRNEKWIKDGA